MKLFDVMVISDTQSNTVLRSVAAAVEKTPTLSHFLGDVK